MFVVFSSDDRSPSASTNNEKQNKNLENTQNSTQQIKAERIQTPEGSKRTDTNFLEQNIQRIRLASLRNKYEILSIISSRIFYSEKTVKMKIVLFSSQQDLFIHTVHRN